MEKGVPDFTFTNWAKTFSCQPELYFQPTTIHEIKEVLKQAAENGKKVRVCGRGHSPSDIACTNDYLVNLDYFNSVLEVDEEKCRIKVEAGMKVSKLNDILLKYNMALTVQGSVSDITIAGSISTGTHGTGKDTGIMSTYVTEIELLTAGGSIIKCSRGENTELFLAASCSLGCLGIITSVTLQCEPHFKLHKKQFPCTLDQVLNNLDDHVSKSEHFKFFWYPHTDGVACFEFNKTTRPKKSSANWFWDYAVGFHLLQFLLWISTFFVWLVPIINSVYFRYLYSSNREDIDDCHKMFSLECLFAQYVTDWAIPREKTAEALRDLNSWLQANPSIPAHFPVEVRFTKGDDILLSPSYGRDTCYINIIMFRPYGKEVEKDDYWTAYENIMLKYGGRPHWAKAHKLTYEDLQPIYPQFDKFCKIREKLDPDGRFVNCYIDKVFIPKKSER